MTSILGVFQVPAIFGDHAVRTALACETQGHALEIHSEAHFTIAAAARADASPRAARASKLAFDDDYVVAADATLYYVPDLIRRLGGRVQASASPAQLVLAAFRAFGQSCTDYLEGDFAFVVWSRRSNTLFCARDFTGRKSLFLTEWRGGLVVSTSLDSIASLPGFHPQVNYTAVGADAAGLFFSLDDDTCIRGVRSLRAGHTGSWRPGATLRTARGWRPCPTNASRVGFDDAAEQLRELLVGSVRERLCETAPTAVWMSGGRDSTAVFGAGMHLLDREPARYPLVPISRSHPLGDSGRENEAIEQVAAFWKIEPRWTDASHTPMFAGFRNRISWGAEPFAQPFEGLTRALATAGAELGSPVALDGYGGDFLFQVSRIYLADLVAAGQVRKAFRDWRVMDRSGEGLRGFYDHGVQPNLPRWTAKAIGMASRGRALRQTMERIPPPWIRQEFLREHGLQERFDVLGPVAQPATSAAQRETQFYLSHQFFARVNSKMARFALDHGVEIRSPLLDRRVVDLALSRPRDEQNNAGDNKRLLRASMRGLLPETILAPRARKTGTLVSYFDHHMRTDGVSQLNRVLPARALADAGIVDDEVLVQSVARYRQEGHAYRYAEALFCTLQAELWLRARTATTNGAETMQRAISA